MRVFTKVCAIFFLMVFTATDLLAQDPHLTQYYHSPLYHNPATTGLFNGNYRFTALYRDQWGSILGADAFRTITGSADFRFNNGFAKHDAFGAGLSVMRDMAGASQFGTLNIGLNFSYIKSLNQKGNHFLSAGLGGGLTQRSINFLALRFGNQFNGEAYDPNIDSREVINTNNFTFFDISGGLMWYYMKNKRTNYYAGVSVFHINRPNQSFYDASEVRLYSKMVFQAGTQFKLAGQVDLVPSLMLQMQGPSFETNIGTFVKFFFDQSDPQGNAFYLGPWYRIVSHTDKAVASEALVLATRIDYGRFTFGFSYDFNFSELTRATNGRGAFEVSLIYIGAFANKRPKAMYCPRF